uniref:SIT4 phosphatase-associated family protein n=1 Tax=Solanum tuberosum TaxID=4113 RepID=M1C960_SOLTU
MQPTFPATGKQAPRLGNIGHLTRIANKLVQLGSDDNRIRGHLEKNMEWSDWHTTVLQERNTLENVYRWACGRPTALLDRTRDSDEEDVHNRDYDVAALANNLSQAFQYTIYDNNGAEEGHGALDRDDEDVYFDDESAEVVLRLGDEQGSNLFTNSDWFAFRDDRTGDDPKSTSPTEVMEDINLNGTTNGGNSNSDDEVVVGEQEELAERKSDVMPSSSSDAFNGVGGADSANGGDFNQQKDKAVVSGDGGFFHFEKSDSDDPFGDRPIPEWVAWGNGSVGGSVNPFEDNGDCSGNLANSGEAVTPSISSTSCSGGESIPNGISTSPDSNKSSSGSNSSQKAAAPVPSLFEEDVEFVGVELEGTEKAMEHALKEGIVGEAAPLKRSLVPKMPEKDNTDEGGSGVKEFNDANYWRVDQEVTVQE